MAVRQTFLQLFYQGKNVTDEISEDIESFTYTENSHGEADDISLTLKDPECKYMGDWLPTLEDTMQPFIFTSDGLTIQCGTFKMDDFQCSGPPTKVNFNAVSVPNNKSVRQTKNTKAWQKVKLTEIAADISGKGGLALTYTAKFDPTYDRKDQSKETDLDFLKKLCEDEGLSLKVTDSQLVIFSREELEKLSSVGTIDRLGKKVLSWSSQMQNYDTAMETTVEYNDPETGKKNSHTEKTKKKKPGGNKQKIKKRVKDKAHAERIAKAKQREQEAKQDTMSVTIIGENFYRAGDNVDLVNFKGFDGKYFVTKVTHTVPPYTQTLELSKHAD